MQPGPRGRGLQVQHAESQAWLSSQVSGGQSARSGQRRSLGGARQAKPVATAIAGGHAGACLEGTKRRRQWPGMLAAGLLWPAMYIASAQHSSYGSGQERLGRCVLCRVPTARCQPPVVLSNLSATVTPAWSRVVSGCSVLISAQSIRTGQPRLTAEVGLRTRAAGGLRHGCEGLDCTAQYRPLPRPPTASIPVGPEEPVGVRRPGCWSRGRGTRGAREGTAPALQSYAVQRRTSLYRSAIVPRREAARRRRQQAAGSRQQAAGDRQRTAWTASLHQGIVVARHSRYSTITAPWPSWRDSHVGPDKRRLRATTATCMPTSPTPPTALV